MTKMYFSRFFIFLLFLSMLQLGCTKTEQPAESPTPQSTSEVSHGFSPETVAKAESLRAERGEKPSFSFQQTGDPENGQAFLYLAQTSEDPAEVEAALQALSRAFKPETINDKYNETILENLESENPRALKFALEAAVNSVGQETNEAVLGKLFTIAREHKEIGARIGALATLRRSKSEDPKKEAVFVAALSDEPAVVAHALPAVKAATARGEQTEAVKERLTALIKHQDPGLRGEAVAKFGEVYYEQPELVFQVAQPTLQDQHPFVRAQAASAMSRVRTPEAAAAIMGLLDDAQSTEHILTYKDLDGSERQRAFGSRGRVDVAALQALQSLTFGKPAEEQYRYESGSETPPSEEHVAAQKEKARAWYKQHYSQ